MTAALDELEARVAALEAQRNPDTLQSNVITVDGGVIGAQLSGTLSAAGIVLPSSQDGNPDASRIEWRDGGLGGALMADVTAISAPNQRSVLARSFAELSTDTSLAGLQAYDWTPTLRAELYAEHAAKAQTGAIAGQQSIIILDDAGDSDFVRGVSTEALRVARGGTTASIPAGWSYTQVPFLTALPAAASVYPWFGVEPLGAARSITSTEIGSFGNSFVTVGINSTAAQQVNIYVMALGAGG